MQFQIRRAEKKDIQKCAFIEADCFPVSEAADYRTLKKRFRAFPENFLVAITDDKVIGFINGNTTNSAILKDEFYDQASLHDPQGAYMSVFGLDVEPSCQHHGYAHQLLNAYIQLAKERNKKGVILTCKDHLISFYESFGFKCLGVSESTHGQAKWNDMILELQ